MPGNNHCFLPARTAEWRLPSEMQDISIVVQPRAGICRFCSGPRVHAVTSPKVRRRVFRPLLDINVSYHWNIQRAEFTLERYHSDALAMAEVLHVKVRYLQYAVQQQLYQIQCSLLEAPRAFLRQQEHAAFWRSECDGVFSLYRDEGGSRSRELSVVPLAAMATEIFSASRQVVLNCCKRTLEFSRTLYTKPSYSGRRVAKGSSLMFTADRVGVRPQGRCAAA